MSQVWEYNGQQFEFDIMVKDDAVRYEKAIEKVEEKAKQINEQHHPVPVRCVLCLF